MKYPSGGSFKAALEAMIRRNTGPDNDSVVRLRKRIAADRLIARLLSVERNGWVIKGGMALDLRYGDRARMTKDLDLVRADTTEAGFEALLAATDQDLDDYFSLMVGRSSTFDDDDNTATRYQIRVELGGALFERLTVDIGLADSLPYPPDRLAGIRFFDFADLEPIEIPAIPIAHHVAEKVHAYTRTYSSDRKSTRVKDLVDIVLISLESSFTAGELRTALEQTFSPRGTHDLPAHLPSPPAEWSVPFGELAKRIGLNPDIDEGYSRAVLLLDPVLSGEVVGTSMWDRTGRWS